MCNLPSIEWKSLQYSKHPTIQHLKTLYLPHSNLVKLQYSKVWFMVLFLLCTRFSQKGGPTRLSSLFSSLSLSLSETSHTSILLSSARPNMERLVPLEALQSSKSFIGLKELKQRRIQEKLNQLFLMILMRVSYRRPQCPSKLHFLVLFGVYLSIVWHFYMKTLILGVARL